MQQIMHKILQLYPLIQSKLKEGMEVGLGMCKVVVEFATVNRCLLLRGGAEEGGAGEGEGSDEQDPAGSQSQEEALEMMQLVLVRGGEGRGREGGGEGRGRGCQGMAKGTEPFRHKLERPPCVVC